MKFLLTGKNGQLGTELQRTLAPLGTVHASDVEDLDLRDLASLRALIREVKPNVVINASAYTAVDRAESQPDLALAINGTAPGVMAEEAQRIGAAFIHFSTDYVFDGSKGVPYTEADTPNPLGVYGSSKLAGEQAIGEVAGANLVFRTSWVYSTDKPSFVTKFLSWARAHETLRIVDDQVSNPTWCRTLAEITTRLLEEGGDHMPDWIGERRGLYHLTADGYASRYEWAQAILANDPLADEQVVKKLVPTVTSEFPAPAERPSFTALDCTLFDETFGIPRPEWAEALKVAMRSD